MKDKKLVEVVKTHNGKFIKTYLAKYQTKMGERYYEIASRKDNPDVQNKNARPDAVRIIPYYYDEKGNLKVVLIKEFRFAINKYIYGTPAGLIDKGEDPIVSAKRELYEEIGAKVIKCKLTEKTSYSSAGIIDESLVCFEAEVKLTGKQHLDQYEDISIVTVGLKKLEKMLDTQEFDLPSRLQLRSFLYKQLLKEAKPKEKIGAYVGKFLPPHIGHMSVIDKALEECDKLCVVLSDNPEKSKKICDRDNFPYFDSKTRLNWIKKEYKNNKKIKFYIIDESKLKNPHDMEEYAQLFWESVDEDVNVKYADESYRELNEKFFPECKFVPLNRDLIPIHGTDIRQNNDFLKYAIKEARNDIKNFNNEGEKNE